MSYALHPNVLAAVTIWQEARGEPIEGKIAVAQVIRNRMNRKFHSDGTVAGTVLKPYQFSGWNTQDSNRVLAALVDTDDDSYVECVSAWDMSGYQLTPLFPAVLYHSKHMDKYPSWTKSPRVTQIAVIGNHIFYNEET